MVHLISTWQKPAEGFVKIKVDFAAFPSINSAGIGMVLRDDIGSFMAARTQRLDGEGDPYIGKLLAARAGLLLAWDLGFEKVELETDALNVYRSIKDGIEDISYNGNILRDIFLYSSWFKCFDCMFAPRCCNKFADAVANHGKDSSLHTWVDYPPGFLSHILLLDFSL